MSALAPSPKNDRKPGHIEQACRDKGLRMTDQRQIIVDILGQAQDHPDVVELHRRAAAIDARISLSTVYRTVKRLENEGIIERHAFNDGRARYEHAARDHHDHLIDLKTGKVIEFRSEAIEKLQAEIARKNGFQLVSHQLVLYAVPLDDF
jgi:Fur family transcriptional regulator, ferric uptake regulator